MKSALGLGEGFDGPIPFHAVSRAGVLFNALDCEDLRKALEQHRATLDPEVVIIESARATLAGDENSARDVAAHWREVRGVFGNRTVIVSHHNDRSVVSERSSGSNYWPGGADTVCAITRRLKDTMRLEPVKTRDTEEPDPFNIQLVDDGPNSPVELRFGGFVKAKVRRPDLKIVGDLDRQIVTRLETDPTQVVDMACVDKRARARGVHPRTGERALDKLVDQGLVARGAKASGVMGSDNMTMLSRQMVNVHGWSPPMGGPIRSPIEGTCSLYRRFVQLPNQFPIIIQ